MGVIRSAPARYTAPMTSSSSTLRVALPVPLPHLFDYAPPPGPAPDPGMTGQRVRVPFGSRELVGVVAGIGQVEDPGSLRAAIEWIDTTPLVTGELWRSLQWLARYTHAPLGEVISTALPGPLRRGEAVPDTHQWGWQLTPAGHDPQPKLRSGTRPQRLAACLAEGVVNEDRLDTLMDDWRSAARSLAKRELVERIALAHAPAVASPA
ncbi:MAG: primosomal protein N', partial [Gammaproteobacteria bacterium]|nr:primosomal protein N' [Gammaproteobacteria bacterium]